MPKDLRWQSWCLFKLKKEHLTRLKKTLTICRESNLHIRREKCSFLQTKIQTLGFVVSHNLIEPDPTKIDMLLKASMPHDQTSLRAFLSLLQYFTKMLVHLDLSHTCHSLYQLTSPNTKFVWTEVHNNAFLAAKDMISKKILNTRFDPSKKSEVHFFWQPISHCSKAKYTRLKPYDSKTSIGPNWKPP